MLARLFDRQRVVVPKWKSRPARGKTRLEIQALESRLALAVSALPVVLTTTPATFGWNILIDDAVDAQGYGRDLYMRRGDDANPYALIADNPEFRDAQRLTLLTNSGPATTFYVTTGGQQSRVEGSLQPATVQELPVLNPIRGTFTFALPNANPLAINGTVVLAPGVSFTYSASGLQANRPNALTLAVNNATSWGNAGLNTSPTGRITTINGISTLTFNLFDTNNAPINTPDFDLTNQPYQFFNPFPTQSFSFNVVAGQKFDQRLIVDLAGTGSRISLQSPWSAALGIENGSTDRVDRDPLFYRAYSGLNARGQVCLYASEVSVSQQLTATSVIDVGDSRGVSERVTMAGDLVRGSLVISNLPASKITDINLNDFVSGPGIPQGTQVTLIDTLNSEVTLSSPCGVNATTASISFTSARYSGYIGLPYAFDVTAEMSAALALDVLIAGNADRDGTMRIAQSGRFTRNADGDAADAVTVRGTDTDIYVEGWINAVSQNYILQSSDAERQFDFTTRSRTTGATVGTIGGGVLAVNLGNLGGTTFDVRTQLNELRVDSGIDLLGRPYRNAISVSEVEVAADPLGDGKLTVSAVAASSGPITIATEDQLTFQGSAIRTSGDLVVDAGGSVLSLPATVTTGNGDVSLRGPVLTAGNVAAGGSRATNLVAGQSSRISTRSATPSGSTTLTLTSTSRLTAGMLAIGPGIAPNATITAINARVVTLSSPTTSASASGTVITFVSAQGDATIDSSVRAGGIVKERVRVATNMPLPALSGLLTVDGIDLSIGDRVLVKTQAKAAQNGIYIASAGSWVRAGDAALSSQLVPGFVVFAEEGQTQEGGWCFSNAFNPVVGETGLMFEAVTATRTYSPVRLATAGANIALFGTTGLVDGRPVNVGDRILVKDQSNKAENGIYVVTPDRWERADQADEVGELTTGSYVAVQRAGITLMAALTATSNSITLATATTANVRVGMLVEGAGVPAGTVVTAVSAPNSITLSQPATATTSSSVTFTAPVVVDTGLAGTTSLDGDLTSGSATVINLEGANGLTAGAVQVGMIVTGTGIPTGTTVVSVVNSSTITLSAAATATSTLTPLTFTANTTVTGSDVVDGLASTAGLREGMVVVGANIPGGSIIAAILSTASIRISQQATGTATGTPLSFFQPSGLTNAGLAFALTNDAVQVGVTPLLFAGFTVQSTRTNLWSPQQVASSVRVATTIDIALAGLQAIDGVDLQQGDRVLVKNQHNPVDNGIWLASTVAWTRAPGGLPRDTSVFIREGASGQGTTWVMNDTVHLMGELTSGSQIVRGLTSTAGLIKGMLAMGPGIVTGATIELVIDTTSVRLSMPPLASDPNAILAFMGIGQVVPGSTPLSFIPAGGDASITAAGNIQSGTALPTSRVQGSTALLTAGRRPDGQVTTSGVIETRLTAGRVTANAPESITIDAAGTLDVVDVRTTTSGGVAITAESTLVARSVIAASATATPSPISLASTLSDVVATTVTTPLGNISLRADGNGRVFVLNGGPLSPGVASASGSVDVVTDNGRIDVAGKVSAAGTGSDVAFRSARSFLQLAPTANVSATDQLIVVTPNGQLAIQPGAAVTANRLAITAQFGNSQGPPPALGTFSAIELNRTDPGNIVFVAPAGLTVEGATTVSGNVTLTAPSLTVTGNVTAGSGAVILQSTAGNIDLAAPVTALGARVTLDASAGVITQSAGQINSQTLVWYATTSPLPGLAGTFVRIGSNLTGPGSLSLGTSTAPIVIVGASTVNGSITITGSNVRIVDVVKANAGDPVSITATNGNIEFVANTLGGVVTVPGPTTNGSVTLTANSGQVIGQNKATRTTVRGGPLAVFAQTADLKCSVASLASTTTVGGLTASAVGALTLAGVTAAGQNVTLNAVSGVSQASGGIAANAMSVTNGSGPVSLTSTANTVTSVAIKNSSGNVSFTNSGSFTVAATGISAGTGSPGDGDISLRSVGGNIALNAGVTAGGDRVTLDATAGLITQTPGLISSQTLVWYAQTQPVLSYTAQDIGLNLTGNSFSPLSITVSPTQRVLRSSTVNGPITITGPSVLICEPVTAGGAGSGVSVTASAGSITFQQLPTSVRPSISAPNGLVTLTAGSGGQIDSQFGDVSGNSVAISSAAGVLVGTMQASTTMSIVSAGGVSVGPQPAGLLTAGSTLDLTGVQGTVRIRNGGMIVGTPLLMPPGKIVTFPDQIKTPAELASVVAAVNKLPTPAAGLTYDIVIGASMTLTQTLTVNRPVTFRGTSTSIVLSGSPSVTDGLALTSGAGGSKVRDITFSNFSGNGIKATSPSGLTITGIKVMNSGTGIYLSAVQNSLIGGTAPGAGNVLQNCSREGIYSTGICIGTQLVKNTFPGTTTKINGDGKGITIVN